MTITEHIEKLQAEVDAIEKRGQDAANNAHAEMTDRIFVRGERADGGKIGEYENTKPLYVNPKNSPTKKTPIGKGGKSSFKNKKKHKTRYYSSYHNYRDQQGRPTETVNLVLFGNLQNDFRTPPAKEGDSYKSGFSQKFSTDKYKGITKKYGADIFKLSGHEKEIFKNTLAGK